MCYAFALLGLYQASVLHLHEQCFPMELIALGPSQHFSHSCRVCDCLLVLNMNFRLTVECDLLA